MTLADPFEDDTDEACQARINGPRKVGCLSGGAPFINLLAAFIMAGRALLAYDAFVGCSIAVGSVYLFCNHPGLDSVSVSMDWNLVSMAVILPITKCIGWAFDRRERALFLLGTMLGMTSRLWSSVYTWRVPKTGVWVPLSELLEQPSGRDQLHHLFGSFLASVVFYFELPRYTRMRHSVGLQLVRNGAGPL